MEGMGWGGICGMACGFAGIFGVQQTCAHACICCMHPGAWCFLHMTRIHLCTHMDTHTYVCVGMHVCIYTFICTHAARPSDLPSAEVQAPLGNDLQLAGPLARVPRGPFCACLTEALGCWQKGCSTVLPTWNPRGFSKWVGNMGYGV